MIIYLDGDANLCKIFGPDAQVASATPAKLISVFFVLWYNT